MPLHTSPLLKHNSEHNRDLSPSLLQRNILAHRPPYRSLNRPQELMDLHTTMSDPHKSYVALDHNKYQNYKCRHWRKFLPRSYCSH